MTTDERSFEIILKPIGGKCNLKCDYCYYWHSRDVQESSIIMSMSLVEKIVEQAKEAAKLAQVNKVILNWHGGEPLLAGIDFYKSVVQIEKKYEDQNVQFINTMQTNGTLINQKWIDFFIKERFFIGVSLDGPDFIHDFHRVFSNRAGSYKKVLHGLQLLINSGLNPHVLLVVHDEMIKYPDDVYNFCKSLGVPSIDFLPCNDTQDGKIAVDPDGLGDFLVRVFDLWIRDNNPNFEIRYFKSSIKSALGGSPIICSMSGYSCGFPSILPTGDLYLCDSFEDLQEFNLGNIRENTLWNIWTKQSTLEKKKFVSNDIRTSCASCELFFMCGGGCSRALLNEKTNEKELTPKFCPAYKKIHSHVYDYLNKTHLHLQELSTFQKTTGVFSND